MSLLLLREKEPVAITALLSFSGRFCGGECVGSSFEEGVTCSLGSSEDIFVVGGRRLALRLNVRSADYFLDFDFDFRQFGRDAEIDYRPCPFLMDTAPEHILPKAIDDSCSNEAAKSNVNSRCTTH